MIQLALKVDIDTWIGLKEGVPNLLALFRRFSIPASFFVAFGPDNSGKAIRRVWKRGFLQKMWRTNPLRTYGLKTLLYGTLLRPPPIGQRGPDLLKQVLADGHGLGIHGYDHVQWQDGLDRMGEVEVAREVEKAVDAYEEALGFLPESSAAPGWQCTGASLAAQDQHRFLYCSDTRGSFPFVPTLQGREYRTLQIPTTLPTLDELLGRQGLRGNDVNVFLLSQLREDRLNVHTIHAELEGRAQLALFEDLLRCLKEHSVEYMRLSMVAKAVLERGSNQIIRSPIQRTSIPGRAGAVTCQVSHGPA